MAETRDVRRRYTVEGRVQGVGFRYFVVRTARSLGLSGAVRNARDGSVRLVAEGTADALDALVERLRVGPPGAVVADVDTRRGPAAGGYRGFDVEPTR